MCNCMYYLVHIGVCTYLLDVARQQACIRVLSVYKLLNLYGDLCTFNAVLLRMYICTVLAYLL